MKLADDKQYLAIRLIWWLGSLLSAEGSHISRSQESVFHDLYTVISPDYEREWQKELKAQRQNKSRTHPFAQGELLEKAKDLASRVKMNRGNKPVPTRLEIYTNEELAYTLLLRWFEYLQKERLRGRENGVTNFHQVLLETVLKLYRLNTDKRRLEKYQKRINLDTLLQYADRKARRIRDIRELRRVI